VIEVMEDSKIKDWSVVITGKFIDENGEEVVRGNLGDYLKQYGAILKSSVSKKTNLLIVGEEPGAVKIAEAKKNEVRIMQVNEFLDFIKG
jgi:NAD-dependent DNA ligase